jgi:HD-GYP domain-containing protein (c-di-GMP phosphodiesterase class II)
MSTLASDPPPNATGAASEAAATEELLRLRRRDKKLTSLLDVAKALTVEHEIDNLLDLILAESIKTVDADRGSLFIMDRDKNELWSKIALGQKDMIRVPVGVGIAGFVAKTRAPLNITDAYADPRFNSAIDRASGYKTCTILCVPMLGSKQEVVGVVQALNHASGPFTKEDEELLMAFGANAAAAIENANLYKEIERLFEGFVQASVTAIESRDPTTAGHSGRVASLSVTTLESLERSGGPYKALRFREAELREMRYAALLHDFGKVGVREHVLLKANKLYQHELMSIEDRFELARRAGEVEMLRARLAACQDVDRERAKARADEIEAGWRARSNELSEMLDFIRRCNLPTVLEEGGFDRLHDIAKGSFADSSARQRALLEPLELRNLSIARGSLNETERKEIESHVSHTYRFLMQIPWTRDLSRVPDFAHGHHEKLNGGGYPLGIGSEGLPVQTRVMTIADIYDALTASDRPYKKAVPHVKALDILGAEAKRGNIDAQLLEVFIEAKVAERALKQTIP